MKPLLCTLDGLPPTVDVPSYNPARFGIGIVHLGFGAFHRTHQAFYTDTAIAAAGGDWKIAAVSLRNIYRPEKLNAQNGLYTLIEKDKAGSRARIIASIEQAISANTAPEKVMTLLTSAETRIVSLTITEKGYGINRSDKGVDESNPIISYDLDHPNTPQSAIGYIVQALKIRRDNQVPSFTVLCCDNLPNNGHFVKQGVLDFAKKTCPELDKWIEQHTSFPSTMVDRITPAPSDETRAQASQLTHRYDAMAVESETFHQWVVEDNFVMGRPDWAAAGVLFTDDVAPFEEMKLRMLNGAHSMMAYTGFLAGHTYIRDVMLDKAMATLVSKHMYAAVQTLTPIPNVDFTAYADELLERFTNPAMAHKTIQIATDGSQKMAQRIFQATIDALRNNHNVRPFAFATAAWMFFCRGNNESGVAHVVDDPLAPELTAAANKTQVNEITDAFSSIPGLIPTELTQSAHWTATVHEVLQSLLERGIRKTIDEEARS